MDVNMDPQSIYPAAESCTMQRQSTPENGHGHPADAITDSISTSPSRTKALRQVLSKYTRSSPESPNARIVFWWSLVDQLLDTQNTLTDRLTLLHTFFSHSILTHMINDLIANTDHLPHSFVSQVLDPLGSCATLSSDPITAPGLSLAQFEQLCDSQDLHEPDGEVDFLCCLLITMYAPRHRPTSTLASSTSLADFHANFQGPGLILLQDHIIAHNNLFPTANSQSEPVHVLLASSSSSTSALAAPSKQQQQQQHGKPLRTYYSKVLPIIQSSGFGKTRLCVQLSTISPGMLVCLRQPSATQHQESFPPQDPDVYKYFDTCQAHLLGFEVPTTPAQHKSFNLAHLGVLAWLAIYCESLAFYLDQLSQQAGCFHHPPPPPSTNQSKKRPARNSTSKQAQAQAQAQPLHGHSGFLCWSTVVYRLAQALHSPTSGFVPHTLFQEPDLCPQSLLVSSDLFVSDDRQQQQRSSSPLAPGQSIAYDSTPPPLSSTRLRTKLLVHICETAKDLVEHMSTAYARRLEHPELLTEAVDTYMRPRLDKLERVVPSNFHQPLNFLALDECGSMPPLLAVIRRVWFHVRPRNTWILLVDTNSDLSPLTGSAARKSSRRLDRHGTHTLTQPFSTMPLDVNFTLQDRRRFLQAPRSSTLAQLNQMLPKLGRPLWNDRRYQDSHGVIVPQAIISKLVQPADWSWDTDREVPVDRLDDINQNLLALVSRRIMLELTSRSSPKRWYNFVQQQIQHHLRFVGRIYNTSDSIITNTPSEPPLSAAAAWLFRSVPGKVVQKWSMAIQAIVNTIDSVGFDIGASGELGVSLLCAMAIDYAAAVNFSTPPSLFESTADDHSNALFGLVSVYQWLHFMTGGNPIQVDFQFFVPPRKGADGGGGVSGVSGAKTHAKSQRLGKDKGHVESNPLQEMNDWGQRAWLNFKHTVRLDRQMDNAKVMQPGLLAELWLRHAAAQGIVNQPDWDFLIPVYVMDSVTAAPPDQTKEAFDHSKLSYVAIQVKNRIKSPSLVELEARVGPRLLAPIDLDAKAVDDPHQHGRSKQCLELFIDLKGGANQDPHKYSRRYHPAPAPSSVRHLDRDSWLCRHHILVNSLDWTRHSMLEQLSNSARDQIRLLFGSADSEDTVDFDQARAQHVRQQPADHSQAWADAQTRIAGGLVTLQP